MAEEAGGRRPGGFAFSIPGGLDKPFYTRFRELRKKHGLTDRGLIECLIHLALISEMDPLSVGVFKEICEAYKTTAPSDMPPLPEVV